MAINYTKSHVFDADGRKACFEFNLTDYTDIPNNPQLQELFNVDTTINFVFDGFSENEVLIKKGSSDLTTPNLSQFFILNNAGFLEIYLSEIDGLHWLCYRSTNQVLRTKTRKLVSIKYIKSTNVIELLVNSIPDPIAIKTGTNLRSLVTDFTGVNNANTDNVVYGRGNATGFPDSFSTMYFDSLKNRLMSQAEINTLFQTWRDNRVLNSIGKVIFSSDRLGNGYDIWEMNADGTDPLLLQQGTGDLLDPKYSKTPDIDLDYTYSSNGTLTMYDSPSNGVTTPATLTLANTYSHSKNADGTKIFALKSGYPWDNTKFNIIDATTNTIINPILDIYSPPWSTTTYARCLWGLDANPTNPLKFVVGIYHETALISKLALVTLNVNYGTAINTIPSILLHTGAWAVTSAGQLPTIFGMKFSKDGSKIGFNEYLNTGYTNLHGFYINVDGSGLTDLGLNVEFISFSPDGTSVLLKKTVGGKTQLFSRNLTTNTELNISNNAWNDNYGDWKA